MSNLLISARATLFTLVLTGLIYPLVTTGFAVVLFPSRAHGSLVTDESGKVVGSELIGQRFMRAAYFQPRPSAAGDQGYDATASGGSNLAPSSQKLRDRVSADVARLQKENPHALGPIPADLVSASASGLDPEISPDAARWQIIRVAQARGLVPERIRAVVEQQLIGRDLGLLGEPRVNVLLLNLALDRQFGQPAPEGSPLGEQMKSADARAGDFLELVERSKRGRLKIYLGFAAGVGKTYRMLQEAHALQARKVDVVLGLIETHQRAETIPLVAGLEQVPLRKVEYRGVEILEMDVDGVIARRPQVALVDEIAHTNAPGSKNKRRYQDVLDLLGAGINVICAFNIQHLESLNQLVQRATGVAVRETVPDTFLKQADQIVTLDLAVEDFLERLSSGRIYAPEKITTALQNFFKPENLATLRELALREVAESLDRASTLRPRLDPGARPSPSASQRVMVCMASSPPRAAELLRRGSRMAGRFNTDWFMVYVQTPDEAPERIDAEAQRHLLANIAMARELGAEVVRLEGDDPVPTLIDFARSHGVAHVIVGRSGEPWWRQLLGRSVMLRMVREAAGFDLHILSVEGSEERE